MLQETKDSLERCLLLVGNDDLMLQETKDLLERCFEMKELGEASF
jgi:hypothetical protein